MLKSKTDDTVISTKNDHLKLYNDDILAAQLLGATSGQQRYESRLFDLWTLAAKVALAFVTPTIVGLHPVGDPIQVFLDLRVQCRTPRRQFRQPVDELGFDVRVVGRRPRHCAAPVEPEFMHRHSYKVVVLVPCSLFPVI